MKKVMLTLMMVMGIIISAQAQKPNKEEKREQKREEIKAMKIGFITEKLKLTTDEASKFWPVYNEFHAKMEKLHEERKVNHKKLKKGVDSLTNADAEKIIDQKLVFEEKELALKKEYHIKFKSVLPTTIFFYSVCASSYVIYMSLYYMPINTSIHLQASF